MNREITAKNYFEHIGTIQTANFFYAEKETEYLYILVLTSKVSDFLPNTEHIPMTRYGAKLEEWQAYQHETIYAILEEFKTKSTISLSVYFVDKNLIAQEIELDEQVEPLTKNFTLIVDAFSLQFEEIQNIAKLFDSKDQKKVAGCLIPLCSTFSENQAKFAQIQIKKTFVRLSKAWENEFYKSYTHVELDIPNKTHFFRRLANIAYLKGIKEKEMMAKFEAKSQKFNNPVIE